MHVCYLSVSVGQILMWFWYVLSKSSISVWARAGVSTETLLGKDQTPNPRCGWWSSYLAGCGPGALSAHWLDAAFGSLPGGCPSAGPQPGVLLLERQKRGHFLSKTDVTVFCNVITKMTAVTFALFCSLEASPNTEGEIAGLPKDMKGRTVDGGTLDTVWTSITVKVPQRYWSLDKQRQCRLFLNPLRQDTSSFLFCY